MMSDDKFELLEAEIERGVQEKHTDIRLLRECKDLRNRLNLAEIVCQAAYTGVDSSNAAKFDRKVKDWYKYVNEIY